jgi:hypothetical protein
MGQPAVSRQRSRKQGALTWILLPVYDLTKRPLPSGRILWDARQAVHGCQAQARRRMMGRVHRWVDQKRGNKDYADQGKHHGLNGCLTIAFLIRLCFFRARSPGRAIDMMVASVAGGWSGMQPFLAQNNFAILLIVFFAAFHRFDDHRLIRVAVRRTRPEFVWTAILFGWIIAKSRKFRSFRLFRFLVAGCAILPQFGRRIPGG